MRPGSCRRRPECEERVDSSFSMEVQAARRVVRSRRNSINVSFARPRSQSRFCTEPSKHLHHLRHRRRQRQGVHCHGISRRQNFKAHNRRSALAAGIIVGRRHRRRRRTQRGPLQGHRPSRHQAREHFRERRWTRKDSRLRSRKGRFRKRQLGRLRDNGHARR